MSTIPIRASAGILLAGTLCILAGAAAAQQNANPPAQKTAASATQGMPVQFVVEQKLGEWRASKLVGLDVIGANGEKIGDIRDALVSPDGTVDTVVIGAGGVLGVGEKLVGVPFKALEFSSRNVATTRNPTSNQETFTTGSDIETTSTTTTRDAFVTRGGTPDHVILRVTKADLEKAPTFGYAGRSSTTSAPQGQAGQPGVNGPPPATPPQ